MKRLSRIIVFLTLGCLMLGCSTNGVWDPGSDAAYTNAEQLIVTGCVINEDSIPLQGIYIDISGVRDANEEDLLNYNYAITDSAGHYTIIRYMGRQKPDEVTVEARDTLNNNSQIIHVPKSEYTPIFDKGVEVAIKIVANFTLYK